MDVLEEKCRVESLKVIKRELVRKLGILDRIGYNKSSEYYTTKRYIREMFKIIQSIVSDFSWNIRDVKVLLTSFSLMKNIEEYDICENSLFYRVLSRHILAFREFLASNDIIEKWLSIWDEYLVEYKLWKGGGVVNDVIGYIEYPTKKVCWNMMKEELRCSVSDWKYVWCLFDDIYVVLLDVYSDNKEARMEIGKELCLNKWKKYILDHDVKEHAIKDYLLTLNGIFDLYGVFVHKERYNKCICECIEIISRLSYLEAIPTIFSMLFEECEILCYQRTR